ncbi:hypothetical protein AB0G87_38700 [Streptomyces asoensis]|uniref:hypothetical protein n=1 Tax=Streptomyces asoensis TaxID=249586 RepID=UPI00340DFB1C
MEHVQDALQLLGDAGLAQVFDGYEEVDAAAKAEELVDGRDDLDFCNSASSPRLTETLANAERLTPNLTGASPQTAGG